MNEDFGQIEDRLRRSRALPTSAERVRVEQRVAGARRERPTRRRIMTVPRVAFTTASVMGALMLGAGTTFALTGFDRAPSASSAQYQQPSTVAVLGETNTVPQTQTTPTTTQPGTTTEAAPAAQAPQQEAAPKTTELPFTGLAGVVVIAIGLVLLVGGLALRRVGRDPA